MVVAASGRRPSGVAFAFTGLAAACALGLLCACTTGTTPDCSDAQCGVVVVDGAVDGALDAGDGAAADSGGEADSADARPDGEAGLSP